MAIPKSWKGYDTKFIEGFNIAMPALGRWQTDAAINSDNHGVELPFLYFTAIQSASRRLPVVCGANIFRDKFIASTRAGDFEKDARLKDSEQLSGTLYTNINHGHADMQRKMAKGHMVRREDVQWDSNGDKDSAVAASVATFHYTNACPQHQSINNGIWKHLEDSILERGHTRDPKKATVFTGPILADTDPQLVIHNDAATKIKCPLRFWKVVYYVKSDNKLYRAGFLMSQKTEVEADGYVAAPVREHAELLVAHVDKPFLDFDERKTYQVNVSKIESLAGLKFQQAAEALAENKHAELSMPAPAMLREHDMTFESFTWGGKVAGLVV